MSIAQGDPSIKSDAADPQRRAAHEWRRCGMNLSPVAAAWHERKPWN